MSFSITWVGCPETGTFGSWYVITPMTLDTFDYDVVFGDAYVTFISLWDFSYSTCLTFSPPEFRDTSGLIRNSLFSFPD
jgi:hypothetical protein